MATTQPDNNLGGSPGGNEHGEAGIDVHKVADEIEAEVRARRAAGEYPPDFERELNELFARFAPPERNTDFEAAIERSESLVIVDPVIPVASRNPVFRLVKLTIARLIGWYHSWLSQQLTTIAIALNHALRVLGARVREVERVTGDVARARAVGARIPAHRNDDVWQPVVVETLRGCRGRIAVLECGDGAIVRACTDAGLDAYGVEPRRAAADEARARGVEVRVDDATGHLGSVGDAALDALVLRVIVERATVGELLEVIDAAARCVAPGGRLVICSLTPEAWGSGDTAIEADLLPGRPRHASTWEALLPEQGFEEPHVRASGTDAYVVDATRAKG